MIKKKFACNGTVVEDETMGEVIQLQGDQRKDVQEFLVDKKEGLGLDGKTIKVRYSHQSPTTNKVKLTLYRSTVSKPRATLALNAPSFPAFTLGSLCVLRVNLDPTSRHECDSPDRP